MLLLLSQRERAAPQSLEHRLTRRDGTQGLLEELGRTYVQSWDWRPNGIITAVTVQQLLLLVLILIIVVVVL